MRCPLTNGIPERMRAPYVPQIDALRAIAVIAVLVFHLENRWLPGGYAGVDVFFVVSGYVISRSMMELDANRWWRFLGEFYSRRSLRILPALLVCVGVSFLLTTVFVPRAWLSTTAYQTARYSLWGFGNYGLLASGDGYFDPRIEYNAFAHMWSLGVEEQFYLLFPLIFFVWVASRRTAGKNRDLGTILLGALLLASLAYSAIATNTAPARAYYLLPSRFWELAAGGLLFQAHFVGWRLADAKPKLRSIQLGASLLLIAVGIVASVREQFPFPWALAAVCGTVGVIDVVTGSGASASRMARALSQPTLIWVGRRSYSLYLWHWPIYALFRWTVGLDTAVAMGLALALTFAAATISFRWVETPFRRRPLMRQARYGYLVFVGLACIFVVSSSVKFAEQHKGRFSASVTDRYASGWYDMDFTLAQRSGERPCSVGKERKLLPNDGYLDVLRATNCTRAAANDARPLQLFVTGNSHAWAYEPLLTQLAAVEPASVNLYFKSSGCTLLKLDVTLDKEPSDCGEFFQAVLRDIRAKIQPGDVIFLPALRLPRLSDQAGLTSEATARDALFGKRAVEMRLAARDEARRVLEPFLRAGARVVFEAPKPIFLAPAYRCSDWFNRHNPVCAPGLTISREFMLAFRQPVMDEMASLSRAEPGISVWDPFDILCPTQTCAAIVGGKPYFVDADHVSAYANAVLFPDFVRFIRNLDSPKAQVSSVSQSGRPSTQRTRASDSVFTGPP
jgi:peptidoglycan/LPS O-acetylase OafA/YrhL